MDNTVDGQLITKYRPSNLEGMYGQQHVVQALQAIFATKKSRPHSYLFTGESGTGKTTLARIVAGLLSVDPRNIIEVDGATQTGIDAMREVARNASYQGFGANPQRLVIVDECHALSRNAWQSVLKVVEEPPEHLYWCFCTTVDKKVPPTIMTRCAKFKLKRVSSDDLYDLLCDVVELEAWDHISKDVLDVCAERADGSPREALQNLSTARSCKTREEAANLISRKLEDIASFQLAQILCTPNKCNWKTVINALKRIREAPEAEPAETTRLVVVSYAQAVLLGQPGKSALTDERVASHLLYVLDQFSNFFPPEEKFGPLITACGRVVYKPE